MLTCIFRYAEFRNESQRQLFFKLVKVYVPNLEVIIS